MSRAPFQCKSCRHRFHRPVERKRPIVEARQWKKRLVFVLGLVIALVAALAIVEWENRPSSNPDSIVQP